MSFQKGNPGGPGRPRTAEKFRLPIARAEKRIADRLPELIDNMFALAAGVTVQEVDEDGGTKVYTKAPDRQANQYLIDRILGKPTERKELTGEHGAPIQVHAFDYHAAVAPLAGGSDEDSAPSGTD